MGSGSSSFTDYLRHLGGAPLPDEPPEPPAPTSFKYDYVRPVHVPGMAPELPPDATTVKNQTIPQLKQVAARAEQAWKKYSLSGPYEVDTKAAVVYKNVPGMKGSGAAPDFDAEGNPLPQYVQEIDEEGTRLYRDMLSASNEVETYTDQLNAGAFGLVDAGRSYVRTEQDKQTEVRRQFVDAMDRIKAAYDTKAAERSDDMAVINLNLARQKEVDAGLPGFVQADFAMPRSRATRYSQLIEPSIPDYILPDYRMNAAYGLPGPEGFDDSNYPGLGASSDWGQYPRGNGIAGIFGYALGTDFYAGIPEEIRPMIGRPSVPIMNGEAEGPPGIPYNGPALRPEVARRIRRWAQAQHPGLAAPAPEPPAGGGV